MEAGDRVWDGATTTAELEGLKAAAAEGAFPPEQIQAWAKDLLEGYERHLGRRRLLITELTAEVPRVSVCL